jgi:hypothetical protein
MRSYKSTDAYQYLHSGKVGWVFIHFEDDNLVFLKADVQPSQRGRGNIAVIQLQYYGK